MSANEEWVGGANDRHIALWNLVGAVGFLLCGAFGYDSVNSSWENYQSVLSTFWGSWAFLVSLVASNAPSVAYFLPCNVDREYTTAGGDDLARMSACSSPVLSEGGQKIEREGYYSVSLFRYHSAYNAWHRTFDRVAVPSSSSCFDPNAIRVLITCRAWRHAPGF